MKVWNRTKNTTLGKEVQVAGTFFMRLKGLLGKKELKAGEGLFITPCRGVHSLGMRFSVDVVYVNAMGKVVHLQSLSPWKVAKFLRESKAVLELPLGTIQKTRTELGDELNLLSDP